MIHGKCLEYLTRISLGERFLKKFASLGGGVIIYLLEEYSGYLNTVITMAKLVTRVAAKVII